MKKCFYTWKGYDIYGELIRIHCPEEIWKGSNKYCIFHDPSPRKETKLFQQRFEEKNDYDYKGYYFPEEWIFNSEKSYRNADFRGATFQDVDFENAIFQNANFGGATFQENANFHRVTFQKDAHFQGVTFQRDVDFWAATFHERADFERATFQEYVDLWGSLFQKNACFNEATFRYADFREAIFEEDADFNDAIFQEYGDFWGTTFHGEASFNGASFQKDANFDGATFKDHVQFEDTMFQNASFVSTFFQDQFFSKASFKEVNFREAVFQKKARFGRVAFQNAYFSGTTFREGAFLEGVVVEKNLEFAPCQIGELNLQYAQFLFGGNITANLAEAKFYRAHLENASFIDCTWPERIYEETHMLSENLSFKELETIYRNLKQNMQRQGNYTKAGKFYYREMEMKRKGTENKGKRIWFELYNLLAGYGEKPERTAISALVTILAFAFVYWSIGCLRYPDNIHTALGKAASSIYFSFVTFTTLGLGDIHPSNNLGRSLVCCEAVIGAFLIALFVVVFARKMMR